MFLCSSHLPLKTYYQGRYSVLLAHQFCVCVCAPHKKKKKKKICFHEIKGKSKREFSFTDFLFSLFLSLSFLVQKALTLSIHFPPRYKRQQASLVVIQLSIISLHFI